MNFNQYQEESKKTAIYPKEKRYEYLFLGISAEAGEVADKYKKIIRDKDGKIGKDDKAEIIMELGDVLWYISQITTELGFNLEDVSEKNIEKLLSRKARGKLQGKGDNR